MGAPDGAQYDARTALVRHNGTSGESALLATTVVADYLGYTVPFLWTYVLDPVSGQTPATTQAVSIRLGVWPPVQARVPYSYYGLGTVVAKEGTYYGVRGELAANSASGITVHNTATFSFDGAQFFDRHRISANVPASPPASIATAAVFRGENGRCMYTTGLDRTYVWTDNFVDYTDGTIPPTPINHAFIRFAGTSTGLWVGVLKTPVGNQFWRSTDNAVTFTLVSGVYYPKFWAFGTTLYASTQGTLYASTDGLNWVSKGTPLGSASVAINGMAFDPVANNYLVVGQYGKAVTTADFVTYTPLPGFSFQGHTLFNAVYVPTAELYPAPTATGSIRGKLRLDSTTGPFAARKVYLYDYTNAGVKIAETVSNATTGEWAFEHVAPGSYFVVGAAQGDDLNIPRDFDALGVITVS